MLRIDRTVMPTMARTPTLAAWELDQLRTLENVVRRGHIETVDRGRLTFADGSVAVADDEKNRLCPPSPYGNSMA